MDDEEMKWLANTAKEVREALFVKTVGDALIST